jgi:hypothetical protein
MKLISSEFNFNSTFASIVKDLPDGKVRECLIDYDDLDKDQQLINHAFDIESFTKHKVFLAVKFPYGSRPKRVELVIASKGLLVLCKFTNSKKVDEAALELQSIITSADINKVEKNLKGLVLFPKGNQKAITDKFATKLLPDIRFGDIENLLSGEFSGIFNQSKSSG